MTFDGPPQSYYEPADEPIFTCPVTGESNEDCDEDHDCADAVREQEEWPEEPADFDDYKNGMGRYAPDYHLDDY